MDFIFLLLVLDAVTSGQPGRGCVFCWLRAFRVKKWGKKKSYLKNILHHVFTTVAGSRGKVDGN